MQKLSTRRRVLVGALSLVMLASACTFGSSSTSSGPTAAGDPVEIRVWAHQSRSFNKALKDLFAAYTAAHPTVTFKLDTFDYDTYVQTLQTALPAGTQADILHMFGTWTCSYADFLTPVPESISTLASAQEAFFAAPIGGFTCGDTLYGFPQEFNIEYGATLVNTDLAAAAGVELDGWADWDEFKADRRSSP